MNDHSFLEFIFWQYALQEMNFVIFLLRVYMCTFMMYWMVFQWVIKISSGLRSGTHISEHKYFVCVHKSLVLAMNLGQGGGVNFHLLECNISLTFFLSSIYICFGLLFMHLQPSF